MSELTPQVRRRRSCLGELRRELAEHEVLAAFGDIARLGVLVLPRPDEFDLEIASQRRVGRADLQAARAVLGRLGEVRMPCANP